MNTPPEDYDDTGPSYRFTRPIPDMDPDVYFSLTPTPEGMKPIVDLKTRMCIGYYDKNGAVYDYQGIFTKHYISNFHDEYEGHNPSDTLKDFSQEIWFSLLEDQILTRRSGLIGRAFKKLLYFFKRIYK